MSIQARIQTCKQRIHSLEQRHHRKPHSVQLLAVSKGRSVDEIISAYQAGLHDFGENYYQEGLKKISQLSNKCINWHFIGPVQSNKAKGIATHFNWVHSVYQPRTALALNHYRPRCLPPLNVCIQVNIDQEETKAGIQENECLTLAQTICTLPHLRLRGLMIIPRSNLEAQPSPFTRCAELLASLNQELNHTLDTLSMGMTDSLEDAIQAGSTLVRIGRGIFGAPSYA